MENNDHSLHVRKHNAARTPPNGTHTLVLVKAAGPTFAFLWGRWYNNTNNVHVCCKKWPPKARAKALTEEAEAEAAAEAEAEVMVRVEKKPQQAPINKSLNTYDKHQKAIRLLCGSALT